MHLVVDFAVMITLRVLVVVHPILFIFHYLVRDLIFYNPNPI
jgi:hypothetical protein